MRDRVMMLYNVGVKLENMLRKGNVWYVRHYESYFNRVYIVFLTGGRYRVVRNQNTFLISIGRSKLNVLLAPFKLFLIARKIRPDICITPDIVFCWWVTFLIKYVLGIRIYIMPVAIPDVIYRTKGRSLTGIPIIIERFLIKLSFKTCDFVLTCKAFGNLVKWLMDNVDKEKLIVVKVLPDAVPPLEFYEELKKYDKKERERRGVFMLLYVGRLSKEKMVDHVIYAFKKIYERLNGNVRLTIVGDGPDRENLENLTKKLNLSDSVEFVGFKRSRDLVEYYLKSDMFISPLTGTALREAALCGLPIVAYSTDWILGVLKHKKNAILVKEGDIEDLAYKTVYALYDPSLRKKISRNISKLAKELWDFEDVGLSLKNAFEVV